MNGGYLITFRSITYGQKAEGIVTALGITCTLQRTPKALSHNGCGYCLRFGKENLEGIIAALKKHRAAFGKVYTVSEAGAYREWQL